MMSDQKTGNQNSSKEFENLSILVVEDSPTQALLLQTQLEENRMKVQVARDGIEGLQKLHENLPKIIISDVEMPRLNGYDFCKKVKMNPAYQHIPIILLTSLSNPLDVVRGIECGCDSFLTKPCHIQTLLSTIQDAEKNTKLQKTTTTKKKLEFFFNGSYHQLQIDQEQITSLLLSTYSNAIQKNLELERAYKQLNQAYEEIQKKNEELKQLNELKNQFLGMAAHDLRNPLVILSGYSDVLLQTLKGTVPEKFMQMFDRMKTSSARMLQLINDLLDISVIESGTVSLHLSSVNLPSLIQENLEMLKGLAETKNIQLMFNCKEPIPSVQGDANKIVQVLNNLISNSIKFSKAGDKIEVSLIPSQKEVTMVVKDQGTGLSAEAKKRLFQPFSKTGAIGTAGEKGTGLGLAIVHKIVTKHGGKIWVESEENKGATFSVSLPYQQETTISTNPH